MSISPHTEPPTTDNGLHPLPLKRREGQGLSRFDKIALSTLLGLALLSGVIIALGNRIGLQVVAVEPLDGATNVSTKAVVRVKFDQKLSVFEAGFPLAITPTVSGTLRWEESTLVFTPAQPLAAGTTYTVSLTADLKSDQGRALAGQLNWNFLTRQPQILYVAPDTQGNDQIFTLPSLGSAPVQLTQEDIGIWDYAIAPDGTAITYAAMRQDGGTDLWQITTDGSGRRQLMDCAEAACSGAVWSPDGSRMVYERRKMLVEGAAPGPPRLWWLDALTGETVAVFQDNQWLGYGPRWSPDSQWLSYVSPSNQGVQVYNINDGRNFLIPSRMGGLAVWSPWGDALLVTDIQRQVEGFAVHLLKADPTSGQLTDLSGTEANVEDSSPVWSADGGWIALTRKVAGASMGKQIWLMRPDGSEAHYLTNEPDIHHGLPEWSPDNRYLVYQRYPLKELGAQPAVWLLDIQTGQNQELITPGNRPTWLP